MQEVLENTEVKKSMRLIGIQESIGMVELKALEKLENVHKAQAINYCEACNIADGLLINFGGLSLDFKRVFNKKLKT